MTNLPLSSARSNSYQISDSNLPKSSLLRWLYILPIERKTSLIPWFCFGSLALVVGAGGLILQGTLKQQSIEQATEQLRVKNEILSLVQKQVPGNSTLAQTISAFTQNGYSAVYSIQADGRLALSSSLTNSEGEVNTDVPLPDEQILERALESGEIVHQSTSIEGHKYALAAQTISDLSDRPSGVLVHGSPVKPINSAIASSLLTQLVLSLVVLIVTVYLSKILSQAIANPIKNLQQVVQNFSEGNFSVRANLDSEDELGLLGSTFNVLADSIESNEARFKQDAQRAQLLQDVAHQISQVNSVAEVWQAAVESSRHILNCDRVIYHRFNEDWRGKIVAESVRDDLPQALGMEIDDSGFAEDYAEADRQAEVRAIANIYQEDLQDYDLKILEPLAVVACLITPVIKTNRLAGLLIAHQCNEARTWQQDEITLLTQIAKQLGGTVEKLELLEQQQQAQEQEKTAKENLQRRALELLMEVDPVTQGDLTVQVKVQEDEIGTIGDSYNATIESLRKLVSQVKNAALQVSTTTSEKDLSIKELSTGASAQTTEINAALKRIQDITDSIQAVAQNAKAAETAMYKATETVRAGDEAMNQTVAGFQEIRDTVAATAKKVKRLGESSQKISKVVNVIGNFADQTNLLALNASIEAAHAGEEGRGFAVVADEVRSLARQSAEATAEIEALVAEIQSETNEVVAAMEAGTEQVVAGTKLVDKTRSSLIQISDVSQQIDRLVAEIAAATVEQSQDSEVVSQTMLQVAAISHKTAAEAGEVSASFQDLLTVAQELQDSVAKFKVS